MTNRSYTPSERAEAVGLALAVGADRASARLGYPRRTISAWLSAGRHPEIAALVVESREAVIAKLWEAVTVGTAEVLAGLRDPKARLGDKAQALRIVAEQYALLSGDPTSRSESLSLNVNVTPETTPEQREASRRLADWIDAELLRLGDDRADELLPTLRGEVSDGLG